MIFSKHRRKIESHRRFGSREFKSKIKKAKNYKRVFGSNNGFFSRIIGVFGLSTKNGIRALLILLLILGYYLFLSPKFRIEQVNATGNVQVTSEQITNVFLKAGNERWFLIPKNHYLLLSAGRANALVKQEIPSIKEVVKSNRKWPNQIDIEVFERNKGFIFKTNNEFFVVDDEGVIIKEDEARSDLLIVTNQVEENVAIGETLNPKLVAFIVSMNKQWNGRINTEINEVKIPGKATSEVQFVAKEGWSVLFDINRPVLNQLSNLALLLNKQIATKDRGRLAYIDLRLAKWAYYCFKDAPCSSQPQQEIEINPNPNAQ